MKNGLVENNVGREEVLRPCVKEKKQYFHVNDWKTDIFLNRKFSIITSKPVFSNLKTLV